MASILEYLKTVHELEVDIYINNESLDEFYGQLNELKEQQENAIYQSEANYQANINRHQEALRANQAKLKYFQDELAYPEEVATRKYPANYPQKKSLFAAFFKGFGQTFASYFKWGHRHAVDFPLFWVFVIHFSVAEDYKTQI